MLEAGTGGCLYSFSIAGYSEEADVGSSVLLGHCTRVGIFRTENSVQYSDGNGFCRFGMRSIGKISYCLRKEEQ